jgi:hypothetical protein
MSSRVVLLGRGMTSAVLSSLSVPLGAKPWWRPMGRKADITYAALRDILGYGGQECLAYSLLAVAAQREVEHP